MNNIEKLAIEREVFEIYQYEQGFINKSSFEKDEDGTYFNMRMRDDWRIWIARATAKALQQSSEPVADAVYEVYAGLDNWREVSKAEYDDYKRTKRMLVTANENDFCYAELKDIYDEMYQHKDIARVANQLYKLIRSRTLPPSSVPLEKYNKLLERLQISNRHIKDWWNNFGEGGSNLPPAHSARLVDANEQAIAEAEGKEG